MKIAVAYIKGPRGFKGELTAALFRPSSGSVKRGLEITIQKDDRVADLKVEYVKSLRKGIGIKLVGIDDEQTALSWKGAEILIEADKLEPLEEKEFYHFQIEGAEVFEEDGKRVGIVTQVESTAGNALLIIDTGDDLIMVPFVKAIVKMLDIENKKIVIDKIEGLY
ncbi:MAG: ribosome maturation factor RimM [candidate division Zixibacteria bacterium]